MCVVSMVGDHYHDKFRRYIAPEPMWRDFGPNQTRPLLPVERSEFEQLKRDVAEMKELLKRAVEYDRVTGQPHCENEEKWALLKSVAEAVGISLDDLQK